MHQRFAALVDQLDTKCQQLLAMPPVAADNVPSITPHGGIYLFSEGDEHLYTGRTKGPIRVRIGSSSVATRTLHRSRGSLPVKRLA